MILEIFVKIVEWSRWHLELNRVSTVSNKTCEMLTHFFFLRCVEYRIWDIDSFRNCDMTIFIIDSTIQFSRIKYFFRRMLRLYHNMMSRTRTLIKNLNEFQNRILIDRIRSSNSNEISKVFTLRIESNSWSFLLVSCTIVTSTNYSKVVVLCRSLHQRESHVKRIFLSSINRFFSKIYISKLCCFFVVIKSLFRENVVTNAESNISKWKNIKISVRSWHSIRSCTSFELDHNTLERFWCFSIRIFHSFVDILFFRIRRVSREILHRIANEHWKISWCSDDAQIVIFFENRDEKKKDEKCDARAWEKKIENDVRWLTIVEIL